MAIITKPATLTKGTSMSFLLNKSELASLNEVSSNAYYSDMQNWQSVLVKYKSSNGNQYEVLKFNASNATPEAYFNVSARALDLFEVQTIQIVDFDGGIFTIGRGSLTTADFDVDFNAGNGGGGGGGGGVGGEYTFSIESFWGWDANTYVTYKKDPSAPAWYMSDVNYALIQVGDRAIISSSNGSGSTLEVTVSGKQDLGDEFKIMFSSSITANGFTGYRFTFTNSSSQYVTGTAAVSSGIGGGTQNGTRAEGQYLISEGNGLVAFTGPGSSQNIVFKILFLDQNGGSLGGWVYSGQYDYNRMVTELSGMGDSWIPMLAGSVDGTVKELQLGSNFNNFYFRLEMIEVSE